jgi:acylphosphatase
MNTHARVLISGRVQGVYFRDGTRDEAYRLGVTGWIRNLPDKRVEDVFEGPDSAVSQLVAFCREGPPGPASIISISSTGNIPGHFPALPFLKPPVSTGEIRLCIPYQARVCAVTPDKPQHPRRRCISLPAAVPGMANQECAEGISVSTRVQWQ